MRCQSFFASGKGIGDESEVKSIHWRVSVTAAMNTEIVLLNLENDKMDEL